jgi:hypothetical protein
MAFACCFAQFRYVIINIRYMENHIQLPSRYAVWKFTNATENLVLRALEFKRWVANSQAWQATVITDIISTYGRLT